MRLTFVLTILILTICSCSSKQRSYSLAGIKSYFETESITDSSDDASVHLKIQDSKLQREKKARMGTSWVNAEAIASVGAHTFYLENKASTKDLSAINLQIKDSSITERYSFPVDHVSFVSQCDSLSSEFVEAVLLRKPFAEIKSFLGDQIVGSIPDSTLVDFLIKSFPSEGLKKQELIGFKVKDNGVSLYRNVYLSSGAQTYIFTFILGNLKIAGLDLATAN